MFHLDGFAVWPRDFLSVGKQLEVTSDELKPSQGVLGIVCLSCFYDALEFLDDVIGRDGIPLLLFVDEPLDFTLDCRVVEKLGCVLPGALAGIACPDYGISSVEVLDVLGAKELHLWC